MLYLILILALLVSATGLSCSNREPEAVREVSFETGDGGKIFGNLYGRGSHAVVLAHGKFFDKESWDAQARRFADEGLRVLAIDFRGYGKSTAGSTGSALHEDILGAVRFLRGEGADAISVIGGSMGGAAAARAAVAAKPGMIERLILLSPAPIDEPEKMKAGHILYVVSKDERMAQAVMEQFERAPEPARLDLIEGDAHAQHIFKTEQGDELLAILIDFLGE